MDNNIKVTIWGKEVGRLTWDASRKRSIFEYAPSFLKGELDINGGIKMPFEKQKEYVERLFLPRVTS